MAAISVQTTVAAAGTEVVLAISGNRSNGALAIKALSTNTGIMYVGNAGDGTVSSSTGYPLSAGESVIFSYIGDLSTIMVDASVNGETVAWVILGVM